MPHDSNGSELKEGDVVIVEGVIKTVQSGTDYCNVIVETKHPMYPGEHTTQLALNARQVTRLLDTTKPPYVAGDQGQPTEGDLGREGTAG